MEAPERRGRVEKSRDEKAMCLAASELARRRARGRRRPARYPTKVKAGNPVKPPDGLRDVSHPTGRLLDLFDVVALRAGICRMTNSFRWKTRRGRSQQNDALCQLRTPLRPAWGARRRRKKPPAVLTA